VSRRAFVVWVAAAIAAASSACGPASPAPSAPGASTAPPANTAPGPTSTIAVGQQGAPAPAGSTPSGKIAIAEQSPTIKTFDPGLANSTQTAHFFWPVFDALTWISADGKVMPALAQSWKNVDPKTWDFTLGDFKFHNGRPVQAQDVVDSYNRYRDPAKKLNAALPLATLDTVTAADPRTVRMTTKAPDPTLPGILSFAFILPMQEVNQQGESGFFQNPIGTGAFKPTQLDFANALKFTAVGSAWTTPQGTPHIQDVELIFIPDAGAQSAALEAGDVDAMAAAGTDSLPALQNAGMNIITSAGTGSTHFLLAPTLPPTNDVRVRQAINYAVDKDVVIKAVASGYAEQDAQLIGSSCLGHNPSIQPYPYDPARARQLLSDAGLSNGFSLPMTVVNVPAGRKEIGEAVAAQLEQVGIKTDINVQELAVWLQAFYGGRDKRPGLWIELLNWDSTYEANAVWRFFSSDFSADNGSRWDEPTFDQMYQTAKSTLDPQQRAQLYQQAGQYLRDQAPVLFMYIPQSVGATRPGVTMSQAQTADRYVTLQKA
jgi:peptide/nickel transport system substrate-binding protein